VNYGSVGMPAWKYSQGGRTLGRPNEKMALKATDAEIDFLQNARIGRLATVDAGGRPHVIPVCFAIEGASIFTPLDEKPKRVADGELQRVRNILGNPFVCLVVDRYSEDWDDLAWIQIRARAALLTDQAAGRGAVLAALRGKYPQYRKMALETHSLLRLDPLRILSWRVNR